MYTFHVAVWTSNLHENLCILRIVICVYACAFYQLDLWTTSHGQLWKCLFNNLKTLFTSCSWGHSQDTKTMVINMIPSPLAIFWYPLRHNHMKVSWRHSHVQDSQEFSGNHGLLLCFLMKSDIYSVNMKQKLGISSCKSTLDSVSWLPINP